MGNEQEGKDERVGEEVFAQAGGGVKGARFEGERLQACRRQLKI
jgi:hypothetical protein